MNDVCNEVHVDHSIGEISPTLWVLFDFPFDLTNVYKKYEKEFNHYPSELH